MPAGLLEPSYAPVYSVSAISASTAFFSFLQNRGKMIGGPISRAKILWLNYAMLIFFALPFCLWRSAGLDPGVRAVYGMIFWAFMARAVIEFYLIYVTIGWRCGYGIGHDWAVCALALVMRWRLPVLPSAADARALGFLSAVQLVLLVESYMAWSFSKLASPREGVYFASEEARFSKVNRLSWAAVAVGYTHLAWFLWAARGDFR
ncbi:MAG: hypothetical protein HY077_03710 [Elusimicrobia bacterium]|nr:hypothetical protein [Elusimicrobiota bacterium]